MRPIDADALLGIYKTWLPQLTKPEDAGDRNGVETCICVLEDAPTLDYAPVKHGEWLEFVCDDPYHRTSNTEYKCSECGRFALNKEPYCHCGARMKEDGKDE